VGAFAGPFDALRISLFVTLLLPLVALLSPQADAPSVTAASARASTRSRRTWAHLCWPVGKPTLGEVGTPVPLPQVLPSRAVDIIEVDEEDESRFVGLLQVEAALARSTLPVATRLPRAAERRQRRERGVAASPRGRRPLARSGWRESNPHN